MIIGGVVAVLALVAIVFFVVPAVKGFFGGEGAKVAAGQQVTITIPDGASGDSIASILSENHIVEDPKDYYAAVKKLNADMSLKPGTYSFNTLMDATKVVQQLMEGPNAGSDALTIPEGLTVDQVADRVAKAYDSISKEDFLNQAKASNYVNDYAFLKDAANDSLEGFLFPKTYAVADDADAADVLARTHYTRSFPCIVRHGNVWGCQFHPEKSSALGQRILKNFVNIVEEAGR